MPNTTLYYDFEILYYDATISARLALVKTVSTQYLQRLDADIAGSLQLIVNFEGTIFLKCCGVLEFRYILNLTTA